MESARPGQTATQDGEEEEAAAVEAAAVEAAAAVEEEAVEEERAVDAHRGAATHGEPADEDAWDLAFETSRRDCISRDCISRDIVADRQADRTACRTDDAALDDASEPMNSPMGSIGPPPDRPDTPRRPPPYAVSELDLGDLGDLGAAPSARRGLAASNTPKTSNIAPPAASPARSRANPAAESPAKPKPRAQRHFTPLRAISRVHTSPHAFLHAVDLEAASPFESPAEPPRPGGELQIEVRTGGEAQAAAGPTPAIPWAVASPVPSAALEPPPAASSYTSSCTSWAVASAALEAAGTR